MLACELRAEVPGADPSNQQHHWPRSQRKDGHNAWNQDSLLAHIEVGDDRMRSLDEGDRPKSHPFGSEGCVYTHQLHFGIRGADSMRREPPAWCFWSDLPRVVIDP